MRSRAVLFTLGLYLAFVALGCTSKPATDNNADTSTTTAANDTTAANTDTNNTDASSPAPKAAKKGSHTAKVRREATEAKEVKKQPLVVPSGTEVTVSLGSAVGSKMSKPGETFTGSVAKDVLVGSAVAIPQGANVSGTVTDAKALGKFAGGAVLTVRLDSINVNGSDMPVQTAVKTFSEKGKGKRTALITGGGAALGGIIGGLAGGGKGAAIGLAAGAGAGAGGSALTGNKEIVLPAESDVSFELSQPLEVRQ
jgi:hypothetical protein